MPQGMYRRGRWRACRAATSELMFSDEELDWLKAIDRWKRQHDNRMPDCREVLAVAKSLGYRKPQQENGR